MPIEKTVVFSLAGLTFIFLILALAYYPSYVVFLALNLLSFVMAGFLLPSEPKATAKREDRVISNVIIGLLILGSLALSVVVFYLWRLGPFGRLPSR